MNFRGPQALLELTGGEADSVPDANGARFNKLCGNQTECSPWASR